jgi:hypothetical protein
MMLRNSRAKRLSSTVGWVERSETHHAHSAGAMGFTSFNPSYGLPNAARPDSPVGQNPPNLLRCFARERPSVAPNHLRENRNLSRGIKARERIQDHTAKIFVFPFFRNR